MLMDTWEWAVACLIGIPAGILTGLYVLPEWIGWLLDTFAPWCALSCGG